MPLIEYFPFFFLCSVRTSVSPLRIALFAFTHNLFINLFSPLSAYVVCWEAWPRSKVKAVFSFLFSLSLDVFINVIFHVIRFPVLFVWPPLTLFLLFFLEYGLTAYLCREKRDSRLTQEYAFHSSNVFIPSYILIYPYTYVICHDGEPSGSFLFLPFFSFIYLMTILDCPREKRKVLYELLVIGFIVWIQFMSF